MTPEEKELLEETHDLAEENNKMLHAIRRGMFWGRVYRIVYWVVIIGTAIGLFYFLQPYIDVLKNAYTGAKGGIQNVGGFFK